MFTSTDSIQELGLENIVYCLIWNQFVNISARTYHNYWNSDSSCISMGFNLLLDFRIYNLSHANFCFFSEIPLFIVLNSFFCCLVSDMSAGKILKALL